MGYKIPVNKSKLTEKDCRYPPSRIPCLLKQEAKRGGPRHACFANGVHGSKDISTGMNESLFHYVGQSKEIRKHEMARVDWYLGINETLTLDQLSILPGLNANAKWQQTCNISEHFVR